MESQQGKTIILAAGLFMGNFATALNSSIVPVAMPSIMQYFHTSIIMAGWITMVPLITITGLIVPAGKLADSVGRKRVYLFGMVIFMAGSMLCGVAFSVLFLIVASIIQSIGAAAIYSCGTALISVSFPSRHMGKAMGLIGLGVSMGMLLGPLGGGYIVQYAGWQYVYIVNVPMGLLNFALIRWALSAETSLPGGLTFDVAGAASFFSFVLFFILTLNCGADLGWSSPLVLVMGLMSAGSITFFIRQEMRAPNPMVNLRVFRTIRFTASIISRISFFMISYIFSFTLPFYLQQVMHYPPSHMGLLLSPVPVIRMVIGPLTGWMSDSIGTRVFTVSGMFITGLVSIFFTTMGDSASSEAILLRFMPFGIGLGLFSVANMSALIQSVDKAHLSFAASSISLFRNLGMAMGIASANVVLSLSLPDSAASAHAASEGALLAALENSWWVAAVLGFMGAACSLMERSKIRKGARRPAS